MISVSATKCEEVAERLRDLNIRKKFYTREFLSFDADRETKLRVYLLSAAICHQTHELHHPRLNLWGWDYLEYGFLKMFRERNVLLNPGYLSICQELDIERMLLSAFSPDGDPVNCSLDRLPERAAMLVEVCRVIKQDYGSKVSNLIDSSNGRLIDNGKGLYEILPQFKAFSDPFKKKITFFVKLASDAGVYYVRDPEHIIPIMDYHMQRVLLRMGCIDIDEREIFQDLSERRSMGTDSPIRNACIESLRIIAEESGHGIMAMNDFFWPLGRSCCNVTTLCRERACMKSPCSFQRIVDVASHDSCYFEPVCLGAKDEAFRELWEPVVDTHYY